MVSDVPWRELRATVLHADCLKVLLRLWTCALVPSITFVASFRSGRMLVSIATLLNIRLMLLKGLKWGPQSMEPQEYIWKIVGTQGSRWEYSWYIPSMFLGFPALWFPFGYL